MAKANTQTAQENNESTATFSTVGNDFRTAVLIVSIVANLFVFTAWVLLQVTSRYDTQVAQALFGS